MKKIKIALIAITICLISSIGCDQPNAEADISRQVPIEESEPVVEEKEPVLEVEEPEVENTEEVEEVDNTPKITVSDYTGLSISDAVKKAKEDGFSNVSVKTNDGKDIPEEEYAWKISSQSISAGSEVAPNEELIITCAKKAATVLYSFSIDLENSDNENEIKVFKDDEEISTISKESSDRFIMKTDMGPHELKFLRTDDEETNVEFTYEFELKSDAAVECIICSNKEGITASVAEYYEDLEASTERVPFLKGLTADKAKSVVEEDGINNVLFVSGDEQIDPDDQLIVCEQSIEEDSLKLKNEELVLNCKTIEEYYKDFFSETPGSKFEKQCEMLDVVPKIYLYDTFIEFTEDFKKLTDEEKDNWTITSVKDISKDEEKILRFEMIYAGMAIMPQLVDVKLDDAKKILSENNFYNIKIENKTDVTNPNMLIVSSQNIKADTETAGDTEIVLNVKKRVVPKATPKPTEKAEPTYTFSEYQSKMYVKSNVNVRNLPDKSGEKIGSLQESQEVSVTGKCKETGWYRIKYGKDVAYVSGEALAAQKEYVAPAPKITETKPKTSTNNNNNTTKSNTNTENDTTKSNNSSNESNNTAVAENNNSDSNVQTPDPAPASAGTTYILNTNKRSRRFHKPSCGNAQNIKPENRRDVDWSREKCIEEGYTPCGNCNP